MKKLAAAALVFALAGVAFADPAGSEPGQKVPAPKIERKATGVLGPGTRRRS